MKTKKFRYLIVFCLTTLFCQAQIHDRIDIRSTDINVMKTQEFDQINWKSDYSLSNVGEPELPVYRVSYVLPIDAKVTGVVFLSNYDEIRRKAYNVNNPVQAKRSSGLKNTLLHPFNPVRRLNSYNHTKYMNITC